MVLVLMVMCVSVIVAVLMRLFSAVLGHQHDVDIAVANTRFNDLSPLDRDHGSPPFQRSPLA